MKQQYQVAIIGAGTAGIMTAAQLLKKNRSLSIVIIDPADTHYYQPAWTLVGAGTYDFDKTAKPMKDLIPHGAEWIQDEVVEMLPDQNGVKTKSGLEIAYEYLIVAPGLVNDLTLIEGLQDAVEKGVVCSNYIDAKHTWESLKNFKGGTALFTQPATPIKCGGAPQKIMYLAADYIRKKGLSNKSKVIFATPGTVIFGVPQIAQTLMEVLHRYHVDFRPYHTPVKIDADKKIAYFLDKTPQSGNTDGTDTASKTGAAVRKQVPVVVDNILKLINGKTADNTSYQGYSSCPLVTGYGKMVLAEFNYKNEFTPDPKLKLMLIGDSFKEHWRLWLLKKYMLPYLYWHKMMKGKDV